MKTCSILQQRDRGRVIDCGRPAKYVLPDGRGVCGIHARHTPKAYLVPVEPSVR